MNGRFGVKVAIVIFLILSLTMCFLACEEKESGNKNITEIKDGSDKNIPVFTVTFIDGNSSSQTTVKSGEKLSASRTPEKEGYVFSGWCTDVDCYTEYDFNTKVYENFTLYAKWTLKEKIHIDSKNFSIDENGVKYTIIGDNGYLDLTDDIIFRDKSIRYAFFYDKECTEPVCESDIAVFNVGYGTTVYYIKIMDSGLNEDTKEIIPFTFIRKEIYTINYYDVSGIFLKSVTVEEGSFVESAIEYLYVGNEIKWVTKDKREWVFGNNGTVVTGDVDLYAVAYLNEYTVTLDMKGGEADYDKLKVKYGESGYVLPIPIKAGNNFVGWYTEWGECVAERNAVPLSRWEFADDIVLIAKWEPISYTLFVTTAVDVLEENGSKFSYEEHTTSTKYSVYYGANKLLKTTSYDFDNGNLYVFRGWYDGSGKRVTTDREFNVENVTKNFAYTERWFVYKIDFDQSKADISITENENFKKFGNLDINESFSIELIPKTNNNYTFLGWNDGTFSKKQNLVAYEQTIPLKANWEEFTVDVKCVLSDDELTEEEDESLKRLISGGGAKTAGSTVELEITNSADYTFVGWYTEEDEHIITDLIYNYGVMPTANVKLVAKWYETDSLIKIAQSSYGKIYKSISENVCGSVLKFDPNVYTGYTLQNILCDGVEINGLETLIPFEPKNYTASYCQTPLHVTAISGAGQINYSINSGSMTEGVNNGGDIVFAGTRYGDMINIDSSSYPGYVWLGWYDENMNLVSVDNRLTISVNEEEHIYAAWRPLVRNIRVDSQIYYRAIGRGAASGIIPTGRYYEYLSGNYKLTTDISYDETKRYYAFKSYSNTTVAEVQNPAGTQKITALIAGKNENGVRLQTTINSGYRFDGWYTKSGTWISFDPDTIVSSITDANAFAESESGEYGYVAKFTELDPNDYPSVTIFRSIDATDGIVPGTSEFYAFIEGTPSEFTEYCRLNVYTNKTAFKNTEYQGFNYCGLYEQGTISMDELKENERVTAYCSQYYPSEGDTKESTADGFGVSYKLRVAGRTKPLGTLKLIALWDYNRGSQLPWYYKRSNLTNSDLNAGDVYYCGDKSGDSQKLVLYAQPNSSYVFAGWVDNDNNGTEVVSFSTSLIVDADEARPSYKAIWRSVNAGRADENKFNVFEGEIKGGTYEVYGRHAYEAEDNSSTEESEITFKANTYNGYEFLGWYSDGKLVTVDDTFVITETVKTTEEILVGGKRTTVETTCTLISKDKYYGEWDNEKVVFSPLWREMAADITVDTGIDVSLTGEPIITSYYKAENERWYRISINTENKFENNGLGWHGGYEFVGWYSRSEKIPNEYLADKYTLNIPETALETYYRAVWKPKEVSVTINILPIGSVGDSIAYYDVRVGADGVSRIVLQAFPAKGYKFVAWRNSNGDDMSEECYYEYQIPKNVKEFRFSANFAQIRNIKFDVVADYMDETNVDTVLIAQPYIIGEGMKYTMCGNPQNGMRFIEWRENDELISREINYEFEAAIQIENRTFLAKYEPIIREFSSFRMFITSLSSSAELFYDNVKYYVGKNSDGEDVLFLNIDVPNGYGYILKKGNSVIYRTDTDEYRFNGSSEINSAYQIEFYRIKDNVRNKIELNMQTDGTIFEVKGRLEEFTDLSGDTYFNEKWILSASFYPDDDNKEKEYKFIGWYNIVKQFIDSQEIITEEFESVKNNYVIDAKGIDSVYKAYFGYYRTILENEDEDYAKDAGEIEIEDYGVVVTFMSNTDKNVGGVSQQHVNTRSTLRYPNEYLYSEKVREQKLIFAGWYDNEECEGEAVDFSSSISCDITLYAKWIDISDLGNTMIYDGETSVNTSVHEQNYYFMSLTDGLFELQAKIGTIGKTAVIEIRETEFYYEEETFNVGGETKTINVMKKRIVKVIETFDVANIEYGELLTVFDTKKNTCYEVSVRAKTANDYDTVVISLKGSLPLSGGTRDNTVPYANSFTVTAIEKNGYSFAGWYYNGNPIGRTKKFRDDGDETSVYYIYSKSVTIGYEEYENYAKDGVILLVAKWEKYDVTLANTNMTAGVLNSSMSVVDKGTHRGAKAWHLEAIATSSHYTFSGWYYYNSNKEYTLISLESSCDYILRDSDKNVVIRGTWKYDGANGELKQIVYSLNVGGIKGENSPKNVDRFDPTETRPIILYDPMCKVVSDDVEYHYIFEGWYLDSTYETRIEEIDPQEYKSGITVYAKWGLPVVTPVVVNENGAEYVYIGEYPQTIENPSLYESISTSQRDSNGFYIYRGVKYEKINITKAIAYNGVTYEAGEYYFKVEKLKWKVIKENGTEVMLEAMFNIDCLQFNLTASERIENNETVYANNWEYSNIRNWLNNSFKNKYFNEWELNLLSLSITQVQNGTRTGDNVLSDLDKYPWNKQSDTEDMFYIMSYADKTDFKLGYEQKSGVNDDKRVAECTDYAIFRGLNATETEEGYVAAYWTRSVATNAVYVYCVDENGKIGKYKVTDSMGIRPVVTLNLKY